jgi:hypothetical protein
VPCSFRVQSLCVCERSVRAPSRIPGQESRRPFLSPPILLGAMFRALGGEARLAIVEYAGHVAGQELFLCTRTMRTPGVERALARAWAMYFSWRSSWWQQNFDECHSALAETMDERDDLEDRLAQALADAAALAYELSMSGRRSASGEVRFAQG